MCNFWAMRSPCDSSAAAPPGPFARCRHDRRRTRKALPSPDPPPPHAMDFKDYYAALDLERAASEEDVRKAYRKLARKYHPDVSKEPDAETRMRELNEAYDVLR